jgi:SAM-dependent methyltransferase
MKSIDNDYITNQCCLCDSLEHSKPFMQEDGHSIVKCDRCSLVYLEQYPRDLFRFIEDAKDGETSSLEFWSFPKLYKKHKKVFDGFFSQRFKRVNKYNKSKNFSVLDIGIGYGFWNRFLEEKGYKTYGLDVSQEAVTYCQNQGLSCELVPFENFNTRNIYSLVSMFDVLEHFADPRKMLLKTKDLMDENSLLYIQVPNVIGYKIPFKHSLGLPYHLWQFDPKSLKKLLELAGFEVLEYWTGIQGVIGHCERGGPNFLTRFKWRIANLLKRGNRIQILVKIK